MDEQSSLTIFPGFNSSREELRAALQAAALGEFEVYGELGRGGMATVYLAHEIALDRLVALKILDPSLTLDGGMVERFKREARTAAQLSHPHIIPIYGVRQTDRLVYFVMRYVEGRSLDSAIQAEGPLPVDMVQAILHQVAGALAQAHRKGIVHRDIKPANIMIDTDGWAVVTDFGIAKVLEASGLTSTGAAVGTPYYMSPEQYSATEVTGRADQYSLGIVAYEMLTGSPPFGAKSVMELMRAQCFDPVPPVESVRADCPPGLAAMIARMVEKQPEDRYADLDEVVELLAAGALSLDSPVRRRMITLAKSGVKRPIVPPPPTSPIPLSRVVRAAGLGGLSGTTRRLVGLGAISAMALGVWWLTSGPGEQAEPASAEGVQSMETPSASPELSQDVVNDASGAGDAAAPVPAPAVRPSPARPEAVVRPPPPPPSTQRAENEAMTPPQTDTTGMAAGGGGVSRVGYIYLGAYAERGAVVYINGRPQPGFNPHLRWWSVPPGEVRIRVVAEGCPPYDEVRTVAPRESVTVGRRNPCDVR